MTEEQAHEIRNALVCIKYAIKTKDWNIVEIQARRIDRATTPKEDEIMYTVRDIIKHFEGFSSKLYKCTAGKWTIGYGYNIEDRGLPKDICEELLSKDIAEITRWLRDSFVWYGNLNDARKKAIISMVYQLGKAKFLEFKKFLAALNANNFELAYVEALNSKWAQQTPDRARKTALVIRTGDERYFFV